MFHLSRNSQLILLSIITAQLISGCLPWLQQTKLTQAVDIIDQANQNFYLDQRIWYQDIQPVFQGNTIVLKGEAFYRSPIRGVLRKLRQAGWKHKILDSVHYLPDAFPGDSGFAIVTDSYVMSRYQPVDVKQEGTELLYGEPVRLIRDANPYFQVQSATGYLGYIPKTSVRTMPLTEWNTYQIDPQVIFRQTVTLENGLSILMGSRLPYLGDKRILLADGSTAELAPETYSIIEAANNPLRAAIVLSAKQYLGLPYVWGGRSGDGVDCSGFVMQSYALNGINLPRDTDEMANLGRIIGLPGWMDAMLPGDLLFFAGSRRLVTHTAIYLGAGKVIHSLGTGVQIQSLNPDDPNYAENLNRRFIFAKRIFE